MVRIGPDSPLIPGLVGGADVAGLLSSDISLFSLPGNIVTAVNAARASSPNAVAAVVRVNDTGPLLAQLVGDTNFALHDYAGFDLLLYVNFSGLDLASPQLGFSEVGGISPLVPLSLGGIASDARFGGSGSRQTLSSLNRGRIWATLIPDGSKVVSATAVALLSSNRSIVLSPIKMSSSDSSKRRSRSWMSNRSYKASRPSTSAPTVDTSTPSIRPTTLWSSSIRTT